METLTRSIVLGSIVAAAVQLYGAAPTAPQGVITVREYLNIGGVTIPELTNNAKFPNSPDIVTYSTLFEWPANPDGSPPPGDVKNNYGVQLIGYLHPPQTGDYVFAIAADDNARLYLSTDESPNNKVQIASEPEWNQVRTFSIETRRGLVDVGTPFERRANVSRPIRLEQGKAYYVEALMKEAGGGDNLAVAWQTPGGTLPQDGDAPIPGTVLSSIDKQSGPLVITQQPTNTVVGENQSATFKVVVNGTPPYTFQWTKNGADILDATNDTVVIPSVPLADNNARIAVKVTNAAGGSITSANATLTVSTDNIPPTIANATGSAAFTDVFVTFSEPVTAASAGNAANYALNGGLTVSSATVASPTSVRLTTGRQNPGQVYTLTVNNVRDASGAANLIAANSTRNFTAWVFSRGFAQHKFFQDVSGNNIAALESDPRFPNLPTFVTMEPAYEYPPNGGNEGGSNYGNQLITYLIPPVTGDYTFYVSGDDPVELYLSTDEDPVNKTLIAREPSWNNARQWLVTSRRDPTAPENKSLPIALQAGRRYYFEALHTEGGGGDSVGATWQLPGAPEPANGSPPIRGAVMGIYSNPDGAFINITQQPASVSIPENTSATISVSATGSVTSLAYQWQRASAGSSTFADVGGANANSLTTAVLTQPDSGVQYRALLSVPGLTRTSDVATVTITSDRESPTLAAARRSFTDATKVRVVFSELMEAASANVAANYSINNGITLSAAALQADNKTVELTTSAINKGTTNTLTVSNVKDKAGNAIAANSQIIIGFERGVLFLVANNAPDLNPADALIKSRLESLGYFVEVSGATASETTMATGKDLIISSSTVPSGDVGDKFQTVAVPVINWEQALQDNYRMTSETATDDRGTTGGQTSLEILLPNHPLAAGFSGTVAVVTTANTFSWGRPAANASVVGVLPGTQNSGLYAYDKGSPLTDGTPAPERRVMVFMGDDTATIFTDAGWKIFEAAVNWAQNITPPAGGAKLTATRSGANIMISWSPPGGTLESADAVTGTWAPVATATNPHTVTPSGTAKFYRVRR